MYSAAIMDNQVAQVTDIFANLRASLNTVTYESPRVGGPQTKLSEDDHRKEMLFCIFGWKGDIEDLIGDERKILPSQNSEFAGNLTMSSQWSQ